MQTAGLDVEDTVVTGDLDKRFSTFDMAIFVLGLVIFPEVVRIAARPLFGKTPPVDEYFSPDPRESEPIVR